MAFVRLCSVAELPPRGQLKAFTVAGREFCIVNDGGAYAALGNECPHQGAPLNEGSLEGGALVCPWHAWAFSLKTGETVEGGSGSVPVYPVQIQDTEVTVEITGD